MTNKILLVLILVSGVAWGEVPYSPDPYNPTYPVDIIEQQSTYVVEVSSVPACPKDPRLIFWKDCGKRSHTLLADKMGEWAFACHGDKENCAWVYDLAEALNEAHRRRVK